ncbi:MAG: BrnT family toxin [Sphingopyxis granuli]|uniref:BrnT family toxin n=1 Tax=Sphingopyxis TaxID=165697 RepID=UPI001F2672D5|nr:MULTISPECIES: BrnT family toxin [Sphingopyxis]
MQASTAAPVRQAHFRRSGACHRPHDTNRDEEERYKAIGLVDGKLHTAVHVWRGGVVRLISVRRSNAREQRDYHSDPGGSK